MRRRKVASESFESVEMSCPNTVIKPRVGFSDKNKRRSKEVLPAPDGPVRNWNECGSMRKLMSRKTSGPSPYLSPTFSKRTKQTLRLRLLDCCRRVSRGEARRRTPALTPSALWRCPLEQL